MNKRQRNKYLKKLLLHKSKRIKFYTYRGTDKNGVFVCLGFTAKPKQKYCTNYSYDSIKEMLYFHSKSAYRMFDVFNHKWSKK